MLANKMQVNFYDVLSENGIPLYAPIPSGALILSDTALSGFSFVSATGLLKAIPAGSAGVTAGSLSGSGTYSMTSAGAHFGASDIFGNSDNGAVYNLWNQSAGNHSHSGSVYTGASIQNPLHTRLALYNSGGASMIPTGGIIFSSASPGAGFSSVSSWDGNLLGCAPASANANTSSGSNSFTWSNSSSSSGDHAHGPGTSTSRNAGTSTRPQTVASPVTSGGHTHTVSWSGSWTVSDHITLSPWRSDGTGLISKGCIIPWGSASTSLPTGWAFCDGSTVRGTVTPNINSNQYIKADSTNHGTITASGTSFNAGLTSISTPSHTHYSGTSTFGLNVSSQQHGTFSWSHSHSLSYSGLTNPTPQSYGLPFIIYLP